MSPCILDRLENITVDSNEKTNNFIPENEFENCMARNTSIVINMEHYQHTKQIVYVDYDSKTAWIEEIWNE